MFWNRDKENLAVISDHGVIEKLSNLTQTENDMLRAKLALAIGNCCEWAGNRSERLGGILEGTEFDKMFVTFTVFKYR